MLEETYHVGVLPLLLFLVLIFGQLGVLAVYDKTVAARSCETGEGPR